jgi:hypothetical protein
MERFVDRALELSHLFCNRQVVSGALIAECKAPLAKIPETHLSARLSGRLCPKHLTKWRYR